jgi:putative DNA primase/helicase
MTARPPRPTPIRPMFDNFPPELRQHPRWVLWHFEWRDGKWTKPPLRADGKGYADSTLPSTWTDFATARAAYQRGVANADGVGWVIGEGIVGVDIDKCRDPVTGELTADARRIIATINSYTEVSPSGTGVRIFARGELPPVGRKRGNYEMYGGDGGRYLTVTGRAL